ncbi:MAG: phosphotransferase [Actinomycetota bacterium]|nr:phosphotransferase [Actinomycetota bacterium]
MRALEEEPLGGGNTTAGVVRVGGTVRRPAGPWSPTVHALLQHLDAVGFEHAPRSLGFDDRERHVLEYVPGEAAHPFAAADHTVACRRVGALLRELHDATATFTPPADAHWNVVIEPDATDLVVHHDPAPWNLVVGDDDRWVLIDWDNAGPGSRTWDLAYAAIGFVPLTPGTPPADAASRLAALADGYRLDEAGRVRLLDRLERRAAAMADLLADGHRTGTEPWAGLHEAGHTDTWRAQAAFARRHLDAFRTGLRRGR